MLKNDKQMYMEKIDSNIDFEESEYFSCKADHKNITVFLSIWNDDKLISITFSEYRQFNYYGGNCIEGVFEIQDKHYLDYTLARFYSSPMSHYSYRVFAIVDVDGYKIFEVVAKNVIIEKIDEEKKQENLPKVESVKTFFYNLWK